LRAVAKLAKMNLMRNKANRPSILDDLMAEEEAKKEIIKNQEKISWVLTQVLKQNWQEMNDEERRLILEINSLSEKLKEEIRKTLERTKN